MSSDDECGGEEEQQLEPPIDPDDVKAHCHFMILGEPPADHSQFSVLAKKPKWPQNLWKLGTQIYDIRDQSKCLPEPESPDDKTLRFDSHFESGNLSKVFQLGPDTYHCILEYDPNGSGSCQWFYFKVTNTRRDMKYTFYISGFHKGKSLYCNGARIFWYSAKQARKSNISWSRGGTNYAYQVTKRAKNKKKRASLQFQIKFPFDDDEVCLCYALPYTYSDLLKSISQWEQKAKPGWMKVGKVCETEGGRDCPLLTITNPDSQIKESDKKCLFITGRIHPGESNSSYLVHGLLDFLLSGCPEANYILDRTIVKCVPMINIDGVVAGYYRISLTKYDLNRMWTSPDRIMHPVVHETKKLIKEIARTREIVAYLDFHGHSRLHGTFAYGCPNDNDPLLRDKEKTYPRVLSFLSDIFSWNNCVFSFPKDRQAAGRIVVRTEVDVVNSFTIETSFGGVSAGPRAGYLYDEILWKELGSKCGHAVYHLMIDSDSPLVAYVDKEVGFMSPRPLPLSLNEERTEIPVEFCEDQEQPEKVPRKKVHGNIFLSKKPASFLKTNVSEISATSDGVKTPQWTPMQFVMG